VDSRWTLPYLLSGGRRSGSQEGLGIGLLGREGPSQAGEWDNCSKYSSEVDGTQDCHTVQHCMFFFHDEAAGLKVVQGVAASNPPPPGGDEFDDQDSDEARRKRGEELYAGGERR